MGLGVGDLFFLFGVSFLFLSLPRLLLLSELDERLEDELPERDELPELELPELELPLEDEREPLELLLDPLLEEPPRLFLSRPLSLLSLESLSLVSFFLSVLASLSSRDLVSVLTIV